MTMDLYTQYAPPSCFVLDIDQAIRTFYEDTADVDGNEDLLKEILHECLTYIEDVHRADDGLEAMAVDVGLYFTDPSRDGGDIIIAASIKLAEAILKQFKQLGFYAVDGKLMYSLAWSKDWVDFYTPILTRKPFNELDLPQPS